MNTYNQSEEDYINSLKGKKRYQTLLSQVDQEKLRNWEKEQESLKNRLSNEDDPLLQDIMYIGGMDISYDKFDKKIGISGLVVLDYKSLKIVYEDYELVKIEEPYVPGFLAFREVKHLVKLINKLKQNSPQFLPQVILLDGNGILHPKEFGIACHLGVLTDTCTIGCSKSLFSIDGLYRDLIDDLASDYLHKKGDSKELIGNSGRHWGYIYKSSGEEEKDYLVISMGNKITNQTSLKIVKKMCKSKIAEPIRLADLITRRLIKARKKYGKKNDINNFNLKDYLVDQHDFLHSNLEQILDDENNSFIDRGRGRGRGRDRKFRGMRRGFFRGRDMGIDNENNNEIKEDGKESDQEIEEDIGDRRRGRDRKFRGLRRGFFRGRDIGIDNENHEDNNDNNEIEENGKESDQEIEEDIGDRGRGRGRGFFRGRDRGFFRGRYRGFFRGRDRGFFRGRGRGEERGFYRGRLERGGMNERGFIRARGRGREKENDYDINNID